MHDILILGGGPAGLSAALYAARGNMDTLVVERGTIGGQISLTDDVENYPGFPDGISGSELSDLFLKQAEKFGAKMEYAQVNEVKHRDGIFQLICDDKTIEGKSLILAAGADYRRLGIPGEAELTGRGVSYCATCDGAFFRNKPMAVVGGGDAAVEEALFLTKFGTKVTVIHRRDQLRASKIVQDRAFKNEKIEFLWDTVVTSVEGDGKVERLQLKNVKSGETSTMEVPCLFVFIGHIPNTWLVKDLVKLDEHDLVEVDRHMQSSLPGLFACGDCRTGTVRQLVQSAGDGAAAAITAIHYVDSL